METLTARVDDIAKRKLQEDERLAKKAPEDVHREVMQELDRCVHYVNVVVWTRKALTFASEGTLYWNEHWLTWLYPPIRRSSKTSVNTPGTFCEVSDPLILTAFSATEWLFREQSQKVVWRPSLVVTDHRRDDCHRGHAQPLFRLSADLYVASSGRTSWAPPSSSTRAASQ